jgi:hypothetical protein
MKEFWNNFAKFAIWGFAICGVAIAAVIWYLKRTTSENPSHSTLRKTLVVGGIVLVGLAIAAIVYQCSVNTCVSNKSTIWLLFPMIIGLGAIVGIWYLYAKTSLATFDSTTKLVLTIILVLLTLAAIPIGRRLFQLDCLSRRPKRPMQRYSADLGLY